MTTHVLVQVHMVFWCWMIGLKVFTKGKLQKAGIHPLYWPDLSHSVEIFSPGPVASSGREKVYRAWWKLEFLSAQHLFPSPSTPPHS